MMVDPLAIFTADEISQLLVRREGQYLEFKSLWDRDGQVPRPLKREKVRDVIAEYVAAFANADGGVLLLGAEDDGEPTGHQYPEDAISAFFEVPAERLQPPLKPRIQRAHVEGQEVFFFEVDSAPEAVMVIGDGFPYRSSDQVIYESQDVINARRRAYRTVGYEQLTRAEASLASLDLELAREVFTRTPSRGRTVEENLVRYGLVHPRATGYAITNAALLLFGRPPMSQWHPRVGIRPFRVAGVERKHGADRNVEQLPRLEAPLARLTEEAHAFARSQIRRSEKLHDLFFREMPEYPEFAWQEAIVNAVAHRDYAQAGSEIEVWFYEDRMEILSPGEVIDTLTVERLLERKSYHASRNPLIVRVLADIGLMREEGEGIPRMFEEMEASYLRLPEIASTGGRFIVALRNTPIFGGGSPEWRAMVDGLPLTVPQKRVLYARPDGFSNGDYQELNQVDRDQAYREIQELVERGVVLPAEAKGRGAIYRLNPVLVEERRLTEARIPKLRQHFASAPTLTNAEYRGMFGTTRYTAYAELRRFTELKVLTASATRGRGSHYLPGPRLSGGN
jgi:ATP-dependent DNA helicase RecG